MFQQMNYGLLSQLFAPTSRLPKPGQPENIAYPARVPSNGRSAPQDTFPQFGFGPVGASLFLPPGVPFGFPPQKPQPGPPLYRGEQPTQFFDSEAAQFGRRPIPVWGEVIDSRAASSTFPQKPNQQEMIAYPAMVPPGGFPWDAPRPGPYLSNANSGPSIEPPGFVSQPAQYPSAVQMSSQNSGPYLSNANSGPSIEPPGFVSQQPQYAPAMSLAYDDANPYQQPQAFRRQGMKPFLY
jgi:hypothetical protein